MLFVKDVDEDDAETDEDAMGQTSDVEPGDEGEENEEEDTGEEDPRRSRIIPPSSGADTRVQVKYEHSFILKSFCQLPITSLIQRYLLAVFILLSITVVNLLLCFFFFW